MKALRIALLLLFAVGGLTAWHDPAHGRITRAALLSLPPAARQQWAAESDRLISRYCLYPDIYGGAKPDEKARMKIFCEVAGRPIHNVTWKRAEDLQSLEYLLRNIIESIRSGNSVAAAQYAGTLAHYLEDSTCPAHALTPANLNLMLDMLPPPPGKADVKLHTVIERSTPEFDLGSRAPQMAGQTVSQAAASLLDRVYAAIRVNRAGLIELVPAVYADDQATMDRFRLKAATAGAEVLADAYYTAFVLAGEIAITARHRSDRLVIHKYRSAFLSANSPTGSFSSSSKLMVW